MKNTPLTSFAALTVLSVIVLTGLIVKPADIFSPVPEGQTTTVFSLDHSPIGSSTLDLDSGSLVVSPTNSLAPSGVRVHAGSASAMNLEFDPIHLDQGGVLTASLINHAAEPLISVVHNQLEKGTEIMLAIEGLAPLLKDPVISVFTYKDDVQTASFDVPAAKLSSIGTVYADDDDEWTKTYHYICDEFGCSLAVDPDDTFIAFVDDPSTLVPFQYLGFKFELKEGIDESNLVESMQLAGILMEPIRINSENTVPLSFD